MGKHRTSAERLAEKQRVARARAAREDASLSELRRLEAREKLLLAELRKAQAREKQLADKCRSLQGRLSAVTYLTKQQKELEAAG